MREQVTFREATTNEDALIAQHFYQLWQDLELPVKSIRSDWLDITLEFIHRARQELEYKAFVAEIDGIEIASTSCQIFAGLYPLILKEEYRKYGYIWGVYVEKTYRGRGIATKLTSLARDYLQSLNCTRIILHASPLGKPVYTRLGFFESNEMRLDLSRLRDDVSSF